MLAIVRLRPLGVDVVEVLRRLGLRARITASEWPTTSWTSREPRLVLPQPGDLRPGRAPPPQ